MNDLTADRKGFDLTSTSGAFGLSGLRDMWAGMVSGYRAYLAYEDMEAMSDSQLSAAGLARTDLPGAAFKSVSALRKG